MARFPLNEQEYAAAVKKCSPLATYAKQAAYYSTCDNKINDTITIHCYVGQVTAERGCNGFADRTQENAASSNYVVGWDGSIGISVPEMHHAWCTGGNLKGGWENDDRAVTIEVASEAYSPYEVTDAAYKALLDLVTDICKRNNIKKLVWSDDRNERVYHLNGCNMTVHKDYHTGKSCPGKYLYDLHGAIADEVNRRLVAIDAISCELFLTELAATDVKASFKLAFEDVSVISNHLFWYNIYKADDRKQKESEEELIKSKIGISPPMDTTNFNITGLVPNSSYSIEIGCTQKGDSTETSTILTPKILFVTKQDFPKEISTVKLSGHPYVDNSKQIYITFSSVSDWGYWGSQINSKKGYRISLLVNGNPVLQRDNLPLNLSEQSKLTFTLDKLLKNSNVKLLPNTSIQIGVQPWVSVSDTLIIDEESLTSSNSLYIRYVLPEIDKAFLKANNKYYRAILHLFNKKGV